MRHIALLLFSLLASCTYILPEYVFRPEHSHCGHLPQCGGHMVRYVEDPDPMCHLKFRKIKQKEFKVGHLDLFHIYPYKVNVPYRISQEHIQQEQQQEQQRQQVQQQQQFVICSSGH